MTRMARYYEPLPTTGATTGDTTHRSAATSATLGLVADSATLVLVASTEGSPA